MLEQFVSLNASSSSLLNFNDFFFHLQSLLSLQLLSSSYIVSSSSQRAILLWKFIIFLCIWNLLQRWVMTPRASWARNYAQAAVINFSQAMLDRTYHSNYRFFFWVSLQQVVKKPQLVIQEIHNGRNVVSSCEKKNATANAAQMANITTADLIINLNCFICFHLSFVVSRRLSSIIAMLWLYSWTYLHHEIFRAVFWKPFAVLLLCVESLSTMRNIQLESELNCFPFRCGASACKEREIDDGLFGNSIVVASHIFLLDCALPMEFKAT